MNKILICALMCALAPAAFAAEPSFQNLKKLDTVDGYTTYGGESKSGDEFYIFVDGGKKDGQIASINLASVFDGYPGFALVQGKTLADYLRNGDKAEFYYSQCADKTVRKLDEANKVLGETVPAAKLNGVGKMAAHISCMAEEDYKKNQENKK
ncbi:hypothetical protein NELON_06780 [Neisseria elongata subsp. glycolytica ATCC 29315]|uniref:Uncharacterized protein n=1 Tax=Neisseria elongata subsp. glycolytica ATCC 29315 TaxID=546263 RepID=A0A0B5CPX7_NEIEG|nr:hypothetical protein [Neisseria elongata]AJE18625.1 hypothetical protein NELON_06780 [Neisseria elongata subsp. glycolytica ATCC 29315]SQH50509.1 Uncharacterised protein [Neisseria elongata subsp. glycolytica]